MQLIFSVTPIIVFTDGSKCDIDFANIEPYKFYVKNENISNYLTAYKALGPDEFALFLLKGGAKAEEFNTISCIKNKFGSTYNWVNDYCFKQLEKLGDDVVYDILLKKTGKRIESDSDFKIRMTSTYEIIPEFLDFSFFDRESEFNETLNTLNTIALNTILSTKKESEIPDIIKLFKDNNIDNSDIINNLMNMK